MSLEGTLETIALPDVLALLSVTAKTGELRIEAGGGVGSVWFDAGRIAGFDVGHHATAVDALFALLRLREGRFKFHTGTDPVNAMPPQDVVPVLEEAENRLMQWPAIAAAIPSLHSELRLEESVEGTVMLRADQWQLIATVGGGRMVGDVLHVRNLGEFDGCKAIKELIDLRLVFVASTPAPQVEAAAVPQAVETADLFADPVATEHPVPEEPHQEGQVAEEAQVADLSEVWDDEPAEVEPAPEVEEPRAPEPVNRGLLLKFLGSARN